MIFALFSSYGVQQLPLHLKIPRVYAIFCSVNIDTSTPQADLMRLTEGALRRRLARALPFHKEGIRGMLLFFLFPGMLFGFRVGLLITAAVAGAIGATLLFSSEGVGTMIAKSYLVVGAITSLGVAVSVFLQEKKKVNRMRSFLKPDAQLALKAGVAKPNHQRMEVHTDATGNYLAHFDVCAEQRGVHGFLLDLQTYGWAAKLHTSEKDEACLFSWGAGQKPTQAICLFRLDAGVHRLQMRVSAKKSKKGDAGGRPVLFITQMTS